MKFGRSWTDSDSSCTGDQLIRHFVDIERCNDKNCNGTNDNRNNGNLPSCNRNNQNPSSCNNGTGTSTSTMEDKDKNCLHPEHPKCSQATTVTPPIPHISQRTFTYDIKLRPILHRLLQLTDASSNKLKRGSYSKVAEEFQLSYKTIQRLWKIYTGMPSGMGGKVCHRKKNNERKRLLLVLDTNK